MENRVTAIVSYIVSSHQQMAQVLESERHIVQHMAQLVNQIPSVRPSFAESVAKNAGEMTKNIAAYLVSLADYEEALAISLTVVMKELHVKDEGE